MYIIDNIIYVYIYIYIYTDLEPTYTCMQQCWLSWFSRYEHLYANLYAHLCENLCEHLCEHLALGWRWDHRRAVARRRSPRRSP